MSAFTALLASGKVLVSMTFSVSVSRLCTFLQRSSVNWLNLLYAAMRASCVKAGEGIEILVLLSAGRPGLRAGPHHLWRLSYGKGLSHCPKGITRRMGPGLGG